MKLTTRTNDIVFQYLSDLHIENNMNKGIPFIKKVKPNAYSCLILAGDIGEPFSKQFWQFIQQQCHEFDIVIFVCGNHEFYQKSIKQTLDFLRQMKRDKQLFNFHILYKDTIELDNCSIIGSTLWTYTPPEAEKDVLSCINDYKYIEDFFNNVKKRNDAWFDNVCFIQNEIEKIKRSKPPGHKIIVVTHHAPELENTSHPRHEGSVLNYNFACNLKLVVNKVDYWIFGHTHYNGKNGYSGTLTTKLTSNQVGYVNKHFTISSSSFT